MACSFCPTPCPLPNGADAVGEGEKKIGFLQAGYARLQKSTKKMPLPPAQRGGKGPGDRGKKLILNLQQSPGNFAFFSQWLNSYFKTNLPGDERDRLAEGAKRAGKSCKITGEDLGFIQP